MDTRRNPPRVQTKLIQIDATPLTTFMNAFIFWGAAIVGLIGLPIGMLGFLILPPAVISLFNEFAAPREVLLTMLGIFFLSALPVRLRFWQKLWMSVIPGEENPRDAAEMGSGFCRDLSTVIYLNQYWPGTQSTWLIIAYWFIAFAQLINLLNLIGTQWLLYFMKRNK